VAAQEIVQDPNVPYHTVPYSRISVVGPQYRTEPYRTAITNTEKASRLALFLYEIV